MTEEYRGYLVTGRAVLRPDGRWSVAADIARSATSTSDPEETRRFLADDGIGYILEVEALKEGVSLGKSLIDRGIASFG